ncbi:MAG: acetylglutamate kinase, partial [Candidatus Altiarchaeota archaeon]
MVKISEFPDAKSYIDEFKGSIFVIKLGGEVALNPSLIEALSKDFLALFDVGIRIVVVHGGGPAITETMERLGKKPVFVEGLRVTDEETLDIVKMVLVGKINSELVKSINRLGGKAVGLSGKSANLFIAEKQKNAKIDLGFVGDIIKVNSEVVELLLTNNFIPIISPIALTADGEVSLNLNADTAASKLAVALKAKKLILLTNVAGVLDEEKKLVSEISAKSAKELIEKGILKG